MNDHENQNRCYRQMVLSAASYVYVGKKRANNEDNVFFDGKIIHLNNAKTPFKRYFCRKKNHFFAFAVCDGMGGEAFGDLAAYLGVKCFRLWCIHAYRNGIQTWEKDCCDFFTAANNRVFSLSNTTSGNPGCTCSIVVFENDMAYFANVGDSRIYLLRDNRIIQLSTDHTVAAQNGSARYAGGNALTRFLGIDNRQYAFQPSIGVPLNLFPDDIFLLCSDGLTDMLSDDAILDIIQKHIEKPLNRTVDLLMEAAMEAGGNDNCSIILVKYDAEHNTPTVDRLIETPSQDDAVVKEFRKLLLICLLLTLGILINLFFFFFK